jgi:uncharacterized protein YxeA
MKKILSVVLASCVILSCALPVAAIMPADTNTLSVFETYDDGSYGVITIAEEQYYSRAAKTKSGTKKYEYFSANGTLQWTAYLKASFTYNGNTSSCSSVDSLTISIQDNDWSVYSKASSKSGNTAVGDITMARKMLVGSSKFPVKVVLSCDKDGILS